MLSTVTILAFIFIPISLATSIFGMNIQELNAEGQPIWVFLVTTAAILSTALWVWGILYQWNRYIHAPRASLVWDNHNFGPRDDEAELDISQWKRFELLLWLLLHGHVVWCWRSGMIFSLLTSGKLAFIPTCQHDELKLTCRCPKDIHLHESGWLSYERHETYTHSPHAPCTYIYAHRKLPSKKAFSFAEVSRVTV